MTAKRPSSLSVLSGRSRAPWRVQAIAMLWAIVPMTLVGAPALAQDREREDDTLTYSELTQKIEDGQVQRIELDPSSHTAKVELKGSEDGKPIQEEVVLFDRNPELIELARSNNVELDVHKSVDRSAMLSVTINLLFILAIIALIVAVVKRTANASGQAMNFGKSRAKFQMEAKTGITFDDVAGVEEAKEELQEVVSFLKTPERFTAVGAKIPRGVLLVGSPGTGKTLLAKAIAGEAGVPFFSISGSEFVEMFVGVGASRVRDLFKKAKENAPCLVFIDEIDAVGRQRGAGIGGGNDEREQTLNQLLTEMDGFETNAGVIIIAATNRPDVLDLALLRPGRFDRQIMVDPPDFKGRLSILEVHARNKKLAPEVSLDVIARRTPGFTGADLANLLNEAAILTARRRKDAIGISEIDDAIDRVIVGMEGTPLVDSKKKRLIAYHEIGHALVATLVNRHYPLQKVTLIPRGQALGVTWYTPNEEQGLDTRSEILAWITATLGGRAAEEVIFGDAEVTSGASDDLQKVTNQARNMVTRYGMSDLGPFSLESGSNEVFLGRDLMSRSEYSDEIASRVDAQVRAIAQQCYQNAVGIIRDNRALVDRLTEMLIDMETIDGDEFRRLVGEYVDLPSQPEETVEPQAKRSPVGREVSVS